MPLLAVAVVVVLGSSCVTTVPPPPPPPVAAPDDDPPPFYDDLSPYGDWWWNDHYGWVYSPNVDTGWRPYTVGHWVWTDEYGWLWVDREPFGWACHHYGRWLWLDDAGWVWVPGTVWAPAWVVWRSGPGFVGWGPLGPEAVWVPGRGFVVVDVEAGMGPWGWVFVDEPDFLVVNVVTVAHSHARCAADYPRTHVIHRPEQGDGGRVVNRGVDRDDVERATGRKVVAHRVVEGDDGRAPVVEDRDEVVVRRPPEIEKRARTTQHDPPDERARRSPPRNPDLRPLRAPDDDDVDRRFDDERRRTTDRQERERRTPVGVPADELRQYQQRELDELDRAKEKEKAAKEKKKVVQRKVYPKKPVKR